MSLTVVQYQQRTNPLAPPPPAPTGWASDFPVRLFRPSGFPADAVMPPEGADQPPNGWDVQAPVTRAGLTLAVALQHAEPWPVKDVVSITPQGWPAAAPDWLLLKAFGAQLQMDDLFPSQQVPTVFVPGAWMAFTDGPPHEPVPAALQRDTTWQPRGNLTATPQGWPASFPERFIKPRAVPAADPGARQVPTAVTPQGYEASFPALQVKRFNPALGRDVQQPDAAYTSVVTTIVLASVMVPDVTRRRSVPVGDITSGVPAAAVSQAWISIPDAPRRVLARAGVNVDIVQQVPTQFYAEAWQAIWDGPARAKFNPALQRADQPVLAAYASVIITYPDGWQAIFPALAKKPVAVTTSDSPTAAVAAMRQAWISADPIPRRRAALDQGTGLVTAPVAVTTAWGWVVSAPDPLRARPIIREGSATTLRPAILATAGFAAIEGQPAQPKRAKPLWELFWPNSDQSAKTASARPAIWGFIDHRFRTIRPAPPDFSRVINRSGFRIASQPTLLGVSTGPTMRGVDAQAALRGVSAKPDLLATSTGPRLLGVSTGPTIKGNV